MPAALKKLANHLAALNSQELSNLPMDSDMLSLIVSGTLRGEDLPSRYPAFYQKLLENAELRQAFLDALDSIEAEQAGTLTPLPAAAKAKLDFLISRPSAPIVENLEKQNWRATLQRTLEQIQAIFLPPQQMAYRADANLYEDPWFTLLREEIRAAGSEYAVALECTLSNESDEALSPFVNLAVTLGSETASSFPLRASLHWGMYQASLLLSEEGRARFPDIPLASIFDETQQHVQAGLSLTLETTS